MFFTGNYLMAKSNDERFNHLQNGFGYIEVGICFGVEVCLYHDIKSIALLDKIWRSLFSKPIDSGSGKSGGYLSVPTNIRQNKIDVFLKR